MKNKIVACLLFACVALAGCGGDTRADAYERGYKDAIYDAKRFVDDEIIGQLPEEWQYLFEFDEQYFQDRYNPYETE